MFVLAEDLRLGAQAGILLIVGMDDEDAGLLFGTLIKRSRRLMSRLTARPEEWY
jgi:hypothetical protein